MNFLLAIMMTFASLGVQYPADTVLSVVTNYAYLYKEASLSAEKYNFQIEIGDNVLLLNESLIDDFYNVSYRFENVTYSGYVYKECLAVLKDDQEVVLTYNAKTEVKTTVYSLSDPSKEITVVNEETELYLYEGYNRKAEMTAVKFSQNGEIVLGYIKTKDITPYGISNVLIISISAIVACVGVIFILLGISKKKTKKLPFLNKQS